jgi:hypothetical protein
MKYSQSLKFLLFCFFSILLITEIFSFVQIELKKSTAKYHHEYLKALKFMQTNKYGKKEVFTSFLEEKDISLHQQV